METERLRSVLARVRWANVARLLAITAVVVAVVGWARTDSAPPALPDAAPRPVVASPPSPVERRGRAGVERRGPARAEGRRRAGPTRRGDAGPRPQAKPGRPRAAVRRTAAVRRSEAVRRSAGAVGRRGEAMKWRRVATSAPARAGPRWTPAPAAPPDPVADEFGAP